MILHVRGSSEERSRDPSDLSGEMEWKGGKGKEGREGGRGKLTHYSAGRCCAIAMLATSRKKFVSLSLSFFLFFAFIFA